MARIVVCSLSNVTWLPGRHVDSFVEGMLRALARAGNSVLHIRTNDFLFNGFSLASRAAVQKKVCAFRPNLIVTFNNVFPYPAFVTDLDCPIACFAADSYAFFANPETIKKHPDRYYFFNFSNDTRKTLPHWFPEALPNRNIHFGHVTDLRARAMEQDISISFVGSMANWNRSFVDYFQKIPHIKGLSYAEQNVLKNKFFDVLDHFQASPFVQLDANCLPFWKGRQSLETSLIHLITCQKRFQVLSSVSDLGLRIFGYPHAYSEVLLYDAPLFRAFDYTPSVTLEDATQTYNRSQVSLHLPHGHAKEGFSWRVCDILASHATLLSCRQPDLVTLSQGYVDLPLFDSPSEARELAIRLLQDPIWRRDITVASQQMVEDKCRFEPRFRLIEQVIPGLVLFGEQPGEVEWMDGTQYLMPFAYHQVRLLRMIRNALLQILQKDISVRYAVRAGLAKIAKYITRSLPR